MALGRQCLEKSLHADNKANIPIEVGLCYLKAPFRNQGGFHMIGSGRGKIEKPEDLQKASNVAQELRLDGLVVCGGDDSNTNAAVLAEFFKAKRERHLSLISLASYWIGVTAGPV